MKNTLEDILTFWFEETLPVQWFQVSADFDRMVKDRFLGHYSLAQQGLYHDWASSADGALALILLYDQFPRNMFRGMAEAYATDPAARDVATKAIGHGFDQIFIPLKRRFFYLPFEHSEDLSDQDRSVELFSQMREEDPLGYEYAIRHRQVIERFGRFPHRNQVLGRDNTAEEAAYLAAGKTY